MRRIPFVLVGLLSLVVLFLPASEVPSSPPGTDKLIHLGLFAALALTGRLAGAGPLPLGAALLFYAAGSEVAQGLLPLGRSADPVDALADLVGVLLGLAVFSGAGARSARRGR